MCDVNSLFWQLVCDPACVPDFVAIWVDVELLLSDPMGVNGNFGLSVCLPCNAVHQAHISVTKICVVTIVTRVEALMQCCVVDMVLSGHCCSHLLGNII